ncbi:S-type pyocin domain-containing protein [Buttiauxella ferragutiae]|uniref:S-type pyocin domain-containing protein n=1 Tax=Buttiauxella ferragutiae TaxID=82989 RepID=UPI0035268F5C
MTRALVRLGDKTTSGGEVISASSTIIEERNIALNGDMAWCPKETCNGPFQINGTAYYFAEDKPCVATGDHVLCNCKNNQVLGSTTLWVEDSPQDPFEEHRKRAAEWPVTKMAAAAAAITAIPVFAKSVLRGTGNTDAGTADEPQANIGDMSFYQSRPSQPAPEPEQHAQAAKKKKTSPPPPPEPPKKKSLFDKVTGFFFGEAEAMPLPPPPVVMGSSAEAGMAAAAGGATTKANQDAAKALTHTMKHLSGPEVWSGSIAMNLPFVVMGAIVQSKLKGEKSDLLTPEKLLEVAHSKGTVPTRVRYNWITDDETGRLKAVGYHTSTESGRDQVRVRMLEKQLDGSYEFWGDERSDKPLITWTPTSTPGSQDSWNTGNNSPQAGTVTIPGLEHPDIQGVTITTTPVPEEKDFRDYILVFPGNIHPPIYIYLSKPPVELLEVELYKDFTGRSRQGKYEADHMPSKAAVKRYLQQEYPGLDRDLIDSMANRVAAVVIPKEVHQKISQTYGGRNNSDQIAMDAKNLRNALDLNFDAIKPALKEYGVTEEQLEAARAKMHKLNAEQGLYK